jgi:serine protease Do
MLTLAIMLLATTQAATEPESAEAAKGIRVRLVNASAHTIHRVFASRSGTPSWGSNLLKRGPMRPGARASIRLAGDCGTYDLRFVAEKGVELLEDEIEFCDDNDVVTVGAETVGRKKASPPQ